MSLLFNVDGEAAKRTTNIVAASSNYTCCFYAKNNAATTPGGKTLFITYNGVGTYTDYAAIFSYSGGGDGNILLELADGGAPVSTNGDPQFTVGEWFHVAYVRSGTSHKLYINGVLSDTATIDMSGASFTETWIGDDALGSGHADFEIAYFREWERALTDDQITFEYRATFPVTITDLYTDTPLNNDLLDDSGNSHTWTAVGSTSFATQVFPYRYTALCMGASFRWSPVYFPNPYSVSSLGSPVFYVNVGSETAGVYIRPTSSGSSGPGTPLLYSNWDIVVKWFNTSTFSTEVLNNPWADPMIGFIESNCGQANPRVNWDWHYLEFLIRTSTYNPNTSTYTADGMIELKIDGVSVVLHNNININKNSSMFAASLTFYPAGDSDAFFVLNKNVVPTSYTGVQRVPVSPYLVEYLNFNAGDAPTWSNTRLIAIGLTGPDFNSISGLDDTGSASLGATDPNVYGQWAAACIGESFDHSYGSLFKAVSLLPPDDTPGTLIVQKIVVNSVDDETEFDINAGGGLDPATFSLADEGVQVFENVAPGTYSIEEDAIAGYITTYEVSNDDEPDAITIDAGETVYVTITNTKVGSITVIKAASPDTDLEFEFTATNLSPGTFSLQHLGEEVFSDLEPADNYGIEETVPDGWKVQYVVSNGSPIDAISVAAGEDVVVQVLNTMGGGGIWKVPRIPTGPPNTPPNPWVPTDDFPDPDTGEITPVKIPNPFFTTALIQDK